MKQKGTTWLCTWREVLRYYSSCLQTEVARAWRVNPMEPLTVRLHLSMSRYLDHPSELVQLGIIAIAWRKTSSVLALELLQPSLSHHYLYYYFFFFRAVLLLQNLESFFIALFCDRLVQKNINLLQIQCRFFFFFLTNPCFLYVLSEAKIWQCWLQNVGHFVSCHYVNI